VPKNHNDQIRDHSPCEIHNDGFLKKVKAQIY